ncbi:hypothetical protein BV20DRAFT_1053263 [Pilatotrama ljubarskyi]|nr:hypothetical protein BV20DRAFT_1053263 [Pilatotrama ljubarskyi]
MAPMQSNTILLDHPWYWKERDPTISSVVDELAHHHDQRWTTATSFPSEIHIEDIKAGRIPDPFVGFKEHEAQWVGKRQWLYHTKFDLDQDVPVSRRSLKETTNNLLLHFKSAKLVAKEREKDTAVFAQDRRTSATRTGSTWDWGPELMTCGPYRSMKLNAYHVRIASMRTCAHVSHSELSTTLKVDVTLKGDIRQVNSIFISLLKGLEAVMSETVDVSEKIPVGEQSVTLESVVNWKLSDAVQLWWPAGSGTQQLYDVEVWLYRVSQVIHSSNWIPAHNFLTELRPEDYRA